MELDRQAIERRDFPITRRGYDPAAVDAHLRALADEFDELRRAAVRGGVDASVASAAGTQVQSILQVAETAAADLERHALESARRVRDEADRDAQRTREEAVTRARAHVGAVAEVAAGLLERVGSMDGEVSALVESLRAGASRLAADLSAVEKGMNELYDAPSGRGGAPVEGEPARTHEVEPEDAPEPTPVPVAVSSQRLVPVPTPAQEDAEPAPAGGGDIDGARLIALNMALNGESRADTERYLVQNFKLADPLKLIDEVYAALDA